MMGREIFKGGRFGVGSPQEVAWRLSRTRREFLRDAAGVALGSTLLGGSPLLHGEGVAKKHTLFCHHD